MKILRENQDKIALGIIIAVFLLELALLVQLKHLPGPLYGGDLYGHLGYTRNYVLNGFWSDPYFVGEVPFYPWFGNFLIAALAFVTGMSLLKAMIFIPLLTTAAMLLGYYLLGSRFFKSKNAGLVVMLMSFLSRGIPDGAPNLTAWMIAAPFLFYFWLRFEEDRTWLDAALAGVFLGILALTQVAFFMACTGLLVVSVLLKRVEAYRHERKLDWGMVGKYAVLIAIGVAIALLFYGPIIIKYHAHSANPLYKYNDTRLELLGPLWLLNILFQNFISWSAVDWFLYGIIALLGLVLCVMNLKKNPHARLALAWFVVGAIMPMHYYITRALFDTWVLPGHMLAIWFPTLFFFTYGILALSGMLAPLVKQQKQILLLILMIVVGAFFIAERLGTYNSDRWVQYGRQLDPLTQGWLDAGAWIEKNTDKNAVFITNDEACFAMNGVSGRKCVMVRRTHANYFVDVEKRYADGVVLLYGNNSQTTDRLIKQYGVTYFLMEPYMTQTYIKVMPQYKQYLLDNGISFQEGMDRLDPAAAEAQQFPLLLVPAQNISASLFARASPGTMITAQGQPEIQILRIN